MIYEVTAKILFTSEIDARWFYKECEIAQAKGTVINTDEPNMEGSTITLIISNHEQDPNKPSVILETESNLPAKILNHLRYR